MDGMHGVGENQCASNWGAGRVQALAEDPEKLNLAEAAQADLTEERQDGGIRYRVH
jgi:hypothetical protein